jgi:hypothetical protein
MDGRALQPSSFTSFGKLYCSPKQAAYREAWILQTPTTATLPNDPPFEMENGRTLFSIQVLMLVMASLLLTQYLLPYYSGKNVHKQHLHSQDSGCYCLLNSSTSWATTPQNSLPGIPETAAGAGRSNAIHSPVHAKDDKRRVLTAHLLVMNGRDQFLGDGLVVINLQQRAPLCCSPASRDVVPAATKVCKCARWFNCKLEEFEMSH